ncbi:MAG: hypothetical protein U0746_16640 [Gemmataceae bacterium]
MLLRVERHGNPHQVALIGPLRRVVGLLLVPFHAFWLFPLAQCAFAIGFGWMAFGVDWLMRDG